VVKFICKVLFAFYQKVKVKHYLLNEKPRALF